MHTIGADSNNWGRICTMVTRQGTMCIWWSETTSKSTQFTIQDFWLGVTGDFVQQFGLQLFQELN